MTDPKLKPDLGGMTIDELNALPEFRPFTTRQFVADGEGKVQLPSGRVLEGLTPDSVVNIPSQHEVSGAYWVHPETLILWRDYEGVWWRPVMLTNGEWRKARE